MALQFKPRLAVLALATLGWASFCLGQTPQPAPVVVAPGSSVQGVIVTGNISGTVVDQSGAVVAGARAKLTGEDPTVSREALSDTDGNFSFANVAAGPFQLMIAAEGFAPQTSSGILHAEENYIVPRIALFRRLKSPKSR